MVGEGSPIARFSGDNKLYIILQDNKASTNILLEQGKHGYLMSCDGELKLNIKSKTANIEDKLDIGDAVYFDNEVEEITLSQGSPTKLLYFVLS